MSVMSLNFWLSFFSTGKVGTQYFVLFASSSVKTLIVPFCKYSPIVSVNWGAHCLPGRSNGFGTAFKGAFTPFKIPDRSTLSAPKFSHSWMEFLGPKNGHAGVLLEFMSRVVKLFSPGPLQVACPNFVWGMWAHPHPG